ncbi:MAG: ABC transporter ATP-binding protein [Cardiobacteriaceae bacterium]|nr:ABC transporter ATP-binding protein [Cardiobacteriaceae bacterium]
MVEQDVIVRVEHLSFSRGRRKIFNDVSFSIHRGEVVAVMGPSGTGKTTLMQLITGQLKPDAGKVEVLGSSVSTLSRRALMQLRRRMSMLFQSGALFSDMTVAENVAFPLREKTRLDRKLIDVVTAMKLQRVGLRGAATLMPSELSGGMARRVALTRAIAFDPELMIYDEPFTGQDPISLGVLTRLVRDLNDGLRMTSLLVSHDVLEVSKIVDRILLFADGRLLADATPQALFDSADPLVHQFMHAEADGPVAYHYPAKDYAVDLLEKVR